jgi:hypothetical protein
MRRKKGPYMKPGPPRRSKIVATASSSGCVRVNYADLAKAKSTSPMAADRSESNRRRH